MNIALFKGRIERRTQQLLIPVAIFFLAVGYLAYRYGYLNPVLNWLSMFIPLWIAVGVILTFPFFVLGIPFLGLDTKAGWLAIGVFAIVMSILQPCISVVPEPTKTYLSAVIYCSSLIGLIEVAILNVLHSRKIEQRYSRIEMGKESGQESREMIGRPVPPTRNDKAGESKGEKD